MSFLNLPKCPSFSILDAITIFYIKNYSKQKMCKYFNSVEANSYDLINMTKNYFNNEPYQLNVVLRTPFAGRNQFFDAKTTFSVTNRTK